MDGQLIAIYEQDAFSIEPKMATWSGRAGTPTMTLLDGVTRAKMDNGFQRVPKKAKHWSFTVRDRARCCQVAVDNGIDVPGTSPKRHHAICLPNCFSASIPKRIHQRDRART